MIIYHAIISDIKFKDFMPLYSTQDAIKWEKNEALTNLATYL